jgi:Kdo2-lipid IVA lauroyltransferase/acyltransferase
VRRELVRENLARAFPDQPEAWRQRVARESYRHLGREALAMVAMGRRTADDIRERTPISGWDELKRAIDRGRGVVMATAHLGNWELGGASLAVRGIGVDAVVQRQRNRLVDRDIVAAREKLGLRVIDRKNASKLVLPALHAGRVVGFVADQDAGRNGVFVPFFGQLASTHRGAALFALRAEAPLFVGVAVRMPGGSYECRTSEVLVDRSGPVEDVVTRMTAAFTERIEAEIRTAPEQYFWVHKRWKTRPR